MESKRRQVHELGTAEPTVGVIGSSMMSVEQHENRIQGAIRAVAEKKALGIEPTAAEFAISKGNVSRLGVVALGHGERVTIIPKRILDRSQGGGNG